jgi:hypothetical protein
MWSFRLGIIMVDFFFYLYQPGLEAPTLGLGLEPPSVPVGISNWD